ncbi:MAG: hypothetical protein ABS76_31930 [Pelagibacterium sp. SCN 64-44]|nr:MAG: hypothetical protein ABS76_31930 [Pelagibacterium sp. SCN 64-44]
MGEAVARKITAQDVAAAAGVSLSTVDRVLNNRGGVATEKEKRVLDWARKLKLDRALNQRAARTLRIAVLLQAPDNPFHADLQAAFRAANGNHDAFSLQFLLFHTDPNDPRAAARAIGELGARHDGLIICYPQSAGVAAALHALSARIPILTLATDIAGSGRQAYVGPDDYRAGRVAGDLMGRFLEPHGGDVLIVAGLLGMVGQQQREKGFRTVLAERYAQCHIVAVLESREQRQRAGDLVHDMLRQNPSIKGIYNASTGAQPVVDALRTLGRERDVVFITHELTENRRRLIHEGSIDAVIDQGPQLEVRMAIETMARLLGRLEGPAESIITPVHIHMIENA